MAVTVEYKVDAEKVEAPLARLRQVYELVEDNTLDEDEIAQALADIRTIVDELSELAEEIQAATP